MRPMIKLLLVFVFFALIPPNSVLANINVEVSGNGEDSESKVIINSNVKSTTTTSQKSTGKTDIRIETNGEVKEYHGEGDVNINLESSGGNNSVSIQTGGSVVDITESTPSSSASASGEIEDEKTDAGFNIVEFIKKQFDSILNIFLN